MKYFISIVMSLVGLQASARVLSCETLVQNTVERILELNGRGFETIENVEKVEDVEERAIYQVISNIAKFHVEVLKSKERVSCRVIYVVETEEQR